MDEGKRENNKVKKPKSENVKSVLSVYLHRRQFASAKPRLISKKVALRRAAFSNRIRRPNSTLDNFMRECSSLLVEYSLMFEKFMFWLDEQINTKHRCYDIEKLVGPLFCHLYIDLRSNDKPQDAITSSNSFFKTHVDKIDKSKCDDIVKHIIRTISIASDNIILNGSDNLNFEGLKEKFRSRKVVVYIKSESLILLKKFVADNSNMESHVVLLQTFQSWFDFRIISENENSTLEKGFKPKYIKQELKDEMKFKEESCALRPQTDLVDPKNKIKSIEKLATNINIMNNQNPSSENGNSSCIKEDCKEDFKHIHMKDELKVEKDYLLEMRDENKEDRLQYLLHEQELITEQKNKIKNVIKNTKKLPANVCNIKILNNKNPISCGLIRSHANIVAFAERNVLRVMPLQVLVESVCGIDQVDHIKFTHHSRQIYCVALCPKNDVICTGSADHSICVYSLNKVKLLRRLRGHLGPVYCVAISENSKYLASGSRDATARLWSLRSGKPLRVFAGHSDAITSMHFHPNTLYLATGSADRNVRVWCLNGANTVRLLHAAKREVYAVAFSPNGQYLACASDDKKVRVWDLASTKVIHEFKNRKSSVVHLLWSKIGKQLCGGTVSGVVKIWEIRDKEHLKEHKHSDAVLRRCVNGRLISLDFTLGAWTCLSVPKHSPFDSL